MLGKELYDKYKGQTAQAYGSIGKVVGHDTYDLVIAVTRGNKGWPYTERWTRPIYDMIDNDLGYQYVGEDDIINI